MTDFCTEAKSALPDADGVAVQMKTADTPAFVYMVQCADGTLYSGWTSDVEKRVCAHNAGRGAKYTKSRRPVRLVYRQACADKSEALRCECALKRLSRAAKLALCNAWSRQEQGKSQTADAARRLL